MLWFDELIDSPWGQLALQRREEAEAAGDRGHPDDYFLQQIARRDLRWGDWRAFRDLLHGRAIPYPLVALRFSSMLPPHTTASPRFRLSLERRDERFDKMRKPYDGNDTVAAALDLGNVEPLKQMIARGEWTLDVSAQLVTMLFDDANLPSRFFFVRAAADRGRPRDLYRKARDLTVENYRRHLVLSGLDASQSIAKTAEYLRPVGLDLSTVRSIYSKYKDTRPPKPKKKRGRRKARI